MSLLVVILLTVTLQPPFGEAEAKDLGTAIGMSIDVSVQVEGTPTAVIARITGLAGELDSVTLVPRGADRYGQVIRLTEREDVSIAFEYIGADGTTNMSAASTLTALGVDPSVFESKVPVVDPQEESGISPWLLAALAAAFAAIVLMAVWSSGSFGIGEKSEDWTFAGTSEGRAMEPDEPAGDAEHTEDVTGTTEDAVG